jgi:hypothetical protein
LEMLETSDLFKAAFMLAMGAVLSRVRFSAARRPIAFFEVHGSGITRLDQEYRCGRARVNPVQYREQLNHLRDILFEKLRANEQGRRRYDEKHRHQSHGRR